MSTEMAIVVWLVGALAGSMLFFAAAVAPMVFRALPADQAGGFLRAFFPNYYLWGLALASMAALAALPSDWRLGGLYAVVAMSFGYARQALMPEINRARDAELGGEARAAGRFKSLHRRSVVINAVQLVLLIGSAVYLIWAA